MTFDLLFERRLTFWPLLSKFILLAILFWELCGRSKFVKLDCIKIVHFALTTRISCNFFFLKIKLPLNFAIIFNSWKNLPPKVTFFTIFEYFTGLWRRGSKLMGVLKCMTETSIMNDAFYYIVHLPNGWGNFQEMKCQHQNFLGEARKI